MVILTICFWIYYWNI